MPYCTVIVCLMLLPNIVFGADRLTVELINKVIEATDAAAENRDAETIAGFLSDQFIKKIDLRSQGNKSAQAVLSKDEYIELIAEGWEKAESYSYKRENTTIDIFANGTEAKSRSTVVEKFILDGRKMVSKVRMYTTYRLEGGQPVIYTIESHQLVGDTTPK